MKNGYVLVPYAWILDKNIRNELRVLITITGLSREQGYCWASNKYLAEFLSETESSISKKIKRLEQAGYLDITYKKEGYRVVNRELRLSNFAIGESINLLPPKAQNVKYNNINNNIKNKDNNIPNKFVSDNVVDFNQYYEL